MGSFLQIFRIVVMGTLADFLYTPLWWYSRGLLRQFQGVWGSLQVRHEDLALDVWIKNIGTPMYGQYDFAGRVISFVMRLAQIIGRVFVLFVWAVLLLAWLMVWVLIPVGVAYLIVVQIKLSLLS